MIMTYIIKISRECFESREQLTETATKFSTATIPAVAATCRSPADNDNIIIPILSLSRCECVHV